MIFYLHIYIVSFLISVIVHFLINYGLLGNDVIEKYNTKTNYKNIFILFIVISCIFYTFWPDTVVYFSDGEIDKVLANVKDNNVNIHNPTINIPSSIGNAIASLGVGGAVSGGMTSGSALMKSGAPLGVKLGVTAIGGAVGGALFVSANYMNTIAQKKAGYSSIKSSSDPTFSAKSIFDAGDNNQDLEAVLGLLNVNIILHICILYLLLALALLYISNNMKLNTNFLKEVFGENVHNLIIKLLLYFNRTNKIWIVIIWIILIIACLWTLYISNYIHLNMDIMSEIYQNSKNGK